MRTIEDELKPVRHNIAVRSYFDRNKEAADHDTKRIGSQPAGERAERRAAVCSGQSGKGGKGGPRRKFGGELKQ